MYVILFSLCVYARLNKLEERGNEIQRYMYLYTKFFPPLNSTGARCVRNDAVGNPPAKRTQQRHIQLQERLQNLCRDLTTGQKTIAEYLCGVGWNIRLNHQY